MSRKTPADEATCELVRGKEARMLAKNEGDRHHQPPDGTAMHAKDTGAEIGSAAACQARAAEPGIRRPNDAYQASDVGGPGGPGASQAKVRPNWRRENGLKRAQTLTSMERQKGGRRGGAARAAKLAPDQRESIARHAALVRWGKE